MKKLLLGLCLATSFNVLAEDPKLEGKLDVYDFNYSYYATFSAEGVPFTSMTAFGLSTAVNPVVGVSSSTLYHCSALTEKAFIGSQVQKTTQKTFEVFTSCIVRLPIVPAKGLYDGAISSTESGAWESTTDATTGISYGLDGYADALAMVQQEAIEQLVATEEGFGEEMPIAKVLIDDYIKNIKSGVSREEAAGLILDELDA